MMLVLVVMAVMMRLIELRGRECRRLRRRQRNVPACGGGAHSVKLTPQPLNLRCHHPPLLCLANEACRRSRTRLVELRTQRLRLLPRVD